MIEPPAKAARPAAPFSPAQQRGVDFLLTQHEDGVFSVKTPRGKFPDIGLTGLALAALETKPVAERTEAEQKVIDQGLAYLADKQNKDGSFGERVVNYTTCAVVAALAGAGRESFRGMLDNAQKYVLGLQKDEDHGHQEKDWEYGSIGYGGGEESRGDLSNLQFSVEMLRQTGLDAEHEAFEKAILFLQRTQNLREVNDFEGKLEDGEAGKTVTVHSGDDGGAGYYPGNSPAGYVELGDGTRVPRSYGSMTYALLKTYTLCGLPRDDRRVAAAVDWIRQNWTLEINPGASPLLPEEARYQGLFYYYMLMAQALDTMGVDSLEVPSAGGEQDAKAVDWRKELGMHLAKIQRDDGSWLNEENGRWWESQPAICTIYALLALDRCR